MVAGLIVYVYDVNVTVVILRARLTANGTVIVEWS